MKRTTTAAAALALASAAIATAWTIAGTASADDGHRLTVAEVVHLAGNLQASQTAGTVALAGASTDSGTESGTGQFRNGGAGPTGQNVLDAEQTWTLAHGTISVSLHGQFGPLPAQTAAGDGSWQITGGTGDYAGTTGKGSWTAVADFTAARAHSGPPTVTFIFSGNTH